MAVSNKPVQGENKADKHTESNGKEGNWYLCSDKGRCLRKWFWGKNLHKKEGVTCEDS